MDPRQWIIFADNGPEYFTILALCNDAPSEKKSSSLAVHRASGWQRSKLLLGVAQPSR